MCPHINFELYEKRIICLKHTQLNIFIYTIETCNGRMSSEKSFKKTEKYKRKHQNKNVKKLFLNPFLSEMCPPYSN